MKIFGNTKHAFMCTDPGTGKLMWFSADGKITQEICVKANCFDAWQLADKNILYAHFGDGEDGVTLIDENNNAVFTYLTEGEVFGCQPLENGNVLVAEVAKRRIVEVNRKGQVVFEIPVSSTEDNHECMRMARKYSNGYYVVQPGREEIVHYDLNGKLKKVYKTRHDTFGVVVKDNGNILYTYMDGVVELDEDGNEVWKLIDNDIPDINIRWILGIQLLENGNMVLSNWLGHGHLNEGIQFFEITQNKDLVWYCDCREETVIPSSLQILDESAELVCYKPTR